MGDPYEAILDLVVSVYWLVPKDCPHKQEHRRSREDLMVAALTA